MTSEPHTTGVIAPDFIPFARPDITDAEITAVVDVLKSGWLTTGSRAQEFQRLFAEYVGVENALALNSGTAALHLALEAIGVGAGDEIIVPTYTFAASAEVVRYVGARPVLVDVKREDLNISVEAISAAVTRRTRAIIGVDIGGQPCDWKAIQAVAATHGLRLIDDAAHSLPSSLDGRRIGQWADLTAFSFYATKTLTTGEGGMLVTNNRAWFDRAQIMSLHGLSKDAWSRYSASGSWQYKIVAPGYKYNMTDVAAAMGIVQLSRVEEMARRRTKIAEHYSQVFDHLPEVETPRVRDDATTSWHLYLLRLRLDRLHRNRADLIRHLASQNIGASVHFIPLHLHPYYHEELGYQPTDFPVAFEEYMRVVSLPIYSTMSDGDIERVVSAVKSFVDLSRRSGRE